MEFLPNSSIRENHGWKEPKHPIYKEDNPCWEGDNHTPKAGSWMVAFHVVTREPAIALVHINISYGDEPLHQRLMMIEIKSPSLS